LVFDILSELNDVQRMMVLMLLWRIWHVHNEITHDKPAAPVKNSKRFLLSYVESLLQIHQYPEADHVKGKQIIHYSRAKTRLQDGQIQKERLSWIPPPPGWTKLSVDGSYVAGDGAGGTGMILRNNLGEAIFVACRSLHHCSGPLEAELAACMEGLELAHQWTTLPIILETDCAEAVAMLSSPGSNASPLAYRIRETKDLINEIRDVKLVKISRDQNRVSHELTKFGRVKLMIVRCVG
jgi:ribonuclease HI